MPTIRKSWLAIQKRTQHKLEKKLSWLRMLRTDEESIADCGQDLEQIRNKAQALLRQYKSSEDSAESDRNIRINLYQDYALTDDALTQSAIAYLLRNRCEIPSTTNEDTQKFLKYRSKIENQIRRLAQQLENRLPQGRDLTGERILTTLELATKNVPIDNAEISRWQSQLIERPDLAPFPITLESNMDLMWFLTSGGKIGLHIGGIATAKAVRTQRLKSPLGMQSPPARTNKKNVLMDLAMAILANTNSQSAAVRDNCTTSNDFCLTTKP